MDILYSGRKITSVPTACCGCGDAENASQRQMTPNLVLMPARPATAAQLDPGDLYRRITQNQLFMAVGGGAGSHCWPLLVRRSWVKWQSSVCLLSWCLCGFSIAVLHLLLVVTVDCRLGVYKSERLFISLCRSGCHPAVSPKTAVHRWEAGGRLN